MSPESSIAHYRVLSKLGEGGMGAVYRAIDTKLNREVAIKVLPDGQSASVHMTLLLNFFEELKRRVPQ